jgi:Na+-transporting NADH:ubiquinone oxidoreductase subunit C
MFAVTFVSVAILAAIHTTTAAAVSRSEAAFLRKAVLEAAGLGAPPAPADVLRLYASAVVARPDETNARFRAVRDPATGATSAYVFVAGGAGLWGEITAAVGLSADLASLTGLAFLKQNETPGLGARIEEDWFKAQWRGKTGPFRMVPEGTRSTAPDEFDAITGATITSAAVQDILNRTLRDAPALIRETAR